MTFNFGVWGFLGIFDENMARKHGTREILNLTFPYYYYYQGKSKIYSYSEYLDEKICLLKLTNTSVRLNNVMLKSNGLLDALLT